MYQYYYKWTKEGVLLIVNFSESPEENKELLKPLSRRLLDPWLRQSTDPDPQNTILGVP